MTLPTIPRYLRTPVASDLEDRMVFVAGPRQVGKTTFAVGFLHEPGERHPAYLNWDAPAVRPALLRGELPPGEPVIVLDEIHKYARWRNLVKGFFDTSRSTTSFLVTGSARLDLYRRGGDSLQGRYHLYRLHPFSLCELHTEPTRSDVDHLLAYGGFPEPCLRGEERFGRRWQRERMHRVIYDDIRDLESVRQISLLELLAEDLPRRVGSPLSVKNLRELLDVAHDTAERWIRIFERIYGCFRIPPYGPPRIRAVKKEQKLYMWDWSQVSAPGARFENLVASQLLKYCHYREDTEGYRMELRFLRDTDRREVDFVVLEEGRPCFAVECKTGDRGIGRAVRYFRERTEIPRFYQVHLDAGDYEKEGVRVLPFHRFCRELDLP